MDCRGGVAGALGAGETLDSMYWTTTAGLEAGEKRSLRVGTVDVACARLAVAVDSLQAIFLID